MTIDANPLHTAPDLIRATPYGKLLSVLMVAFALGLIALFQFYAFPLLKTVTGATSVPPTPDAILLVKGIFIGLAVIGAVTAVTMIAHARKILRHGQCPPPGAWLWRDTRIVRGANAARYAWSYIVLGALAGIVCVGLGLYIVFMIDRQTPRYDAPKGAAIVQQQGFNPQ